MDINFDQLRLWIAALRSGEYQQAQCNLQSGEGYCCLGVACKVLIPHDKLKLRLNNQLYGGYPNEQANAPHWLQEINEDFGSKYGTTLDSLNDSPIPLSFNEIANLLEKIYLSDGNE